MQTSRPSATSSEAEAPTLVPEDEGRLDVVSFRKTDEGKKLVAWASGAYTHCKTQKLPKARQWYINLAMVFGQQWLQQSTGGPAQGKLQVQPAPRWLRRKTINRLRPFVRRETSKFLSTLPNIVAVPSTAEDEDVRAAYAAEQVWMSYADTKRFRKEYSAAVWWMALTGNGFIKTWWDTGMKVDLPEGREDYGDIHYRKVAPFHLFVPENRETEIEDQPYVIEAKVRTVEWVKTFYSEVLQDVELSASTTAANSLLDEAYLSLQKSEHSQDSVVVYEYWVKPGATKHLPNGGFLVLVDDILVDYYEGLPYEHGQFPYTKFEHMFNDTFWADSPLVDLIPLQKEYNDLRTDLSVAARRMGNPQLLVQKGSVDPSKMTNEPGAQIIYRPGTAPPTPAPLAQIPQYVLEQQDRALSDFEDLSGQHEVSRGSAPAGVTAGTALSYLGERDDQFLTPQYQSIEESIERIAKQTLMLFQQYVDIERKIKVVGADGAFDTLILSGADVKDGTDVRVEPGTGVGQSQAAKQAQVFDLVSLGIIDGPTALKMLEIGGPQKVLDIVNAAERKAQRENMKMKSLKEHPEVIEAADAEFMAGVQQQLEQAQPPSPVDPMADPMAVQAEMEQFEQEKMQLLQMAAQNTPPAVPVDDFDIHEVHIEVHNRFRMSQEYETLPEHVKEQFEKHVKWHQQMGAAAMESQLMSQMPPELGDEEGPGGTMAPPNDQGQPPAGPPA